MSKIVDLSAKLAARRVAEEDRRQRSSILVQRQVARAMKDIAPEATVEQVISVSLLYCTFLGGDRRELAYKAEAWARDACRWKSGIVQVRCPELVAMIEADGQTPTIRFVVPPSSDHIARRIPRMMRVSPHPPAWQSIHEKLVEHSCVTRCIPPEPPVPLVLAGWTYTNDREKRERWEETVSWCANNGCSALLDALSENDFYCVNQPTEHEVGAGHGPLSWNREPRQRPDAQQIATCMANLERLWPEVASDDIACVTRPVRLTGAKARRLVVAAAPGHTPPWGDWDRLSDDPSKRRAFSRLRAAVNRAIAPHEIDHIDFVVDRAARPNS